jgi:2-ketocyclohexanecarboxyl-CoA hydrolase
MAMFVDILYEERREGVATITINRPEQYNAFRVQTVEELIAAFKQAGWDKRIGVVILTGAGDKAFCTGSDQSAQQGRYDGRGSIGLPIEELHSVIRDVPKPVIARVNGLAIGGGNVLATICDLTIASESAQFGQMGPKVGSVDPGFGTAYLARAVGEKKAREIWYLCRRYKAEQAVEMGLANVAVPHDQLDAEVDRWTTELLEKSPTALALAKSSFNADTDPIRGIGALGMHALSVYYETEESREGGRAFRE